MLLGAFSWRLLEPLVHVGRSLTGVIYMQVRYISNGAYILKVQASGVPPS